MDTLPDVSDTCLVCMGLGPDMLDIVGEEAVKLNIGTILSRYFWFDENEYENRRMCQICWSKISEFHSFYCEIEVLHDKYFWRRPQADVDVNPLEPIVKTELKNELNFNFDFIKKEDLEELKVVGEGIIDLELQDDDPKSLDDLIEEDRDDADEDFGEESSESDSSDEERKKVKRKLQKSKDDEKIKKYCNIKCDHCNEKFKNFKALKAHYKKSHSEVEGYIMCCDEKYDEKSSLMEHIRNSHMGEDKEKLHRCDICDRSFVKKDSLKNHYFKVHKFVESSKNLILCQICQKGFTTEGRLKQHQRFAHSENDPSIVKKTKEDIEAEEANIREYCSMTCDQCGFEGATFFDLQKHAKAMHNTIGYVTCCSKKFSKRYRLLDHLKTHADPNSFYCNICNRSYADTEGLQKHMINIHTPEDQKPFKCEICGKSFIKAYQLTNHYGYHVPESDCKFECTECGKKLPTQEFLNRHAKTHHGPTHICHICAREFKKVCEYKAHMLKHDDNYKAERHQCPYCPSRMKDIKHFRKHVRHHEDTNEYFCDICGQKAPHKIALQNHKRRVHFTERTHKCNLCEKSFKTKLNLKEHTATHTGEALYSCDFCPKTFISNANCASHRKKMHPKQWLENKIKKKMEIEMGLTTSTFGPGPGRPPIM